MGDSGGGDSYAGWMGLTDHNHPANLDNYHMHQHMAHRRTGGPVKIIAVHKDQDGNYTVDMQPLVKQVDGAGNPTDHGTIYGIPVHASGGKNGQRLIAPVVGDKGWTQAGDRDHSDVLANNGQASNPASRREHDWADSYYMGGFASLNKPDSSHVQDENGHTFKTKHSHTSSADQDHSFTSTNNHTITAKGHTVNAPTNGMNVKGDLKPTGGTWNLGTGGSPWNGGTVQNAFTVISDQREKIVDGEPLGLDFIRSLRPVSFRWKGGEQGGAHWGLLARRLRQLATRRASTLGFGLWPTLMIRKAAKGFVTRS